jgi:superfamily II DNA or RNA helicase
MPLRDYQQEALDALENYIAIEDGNPLVVMPTGSGKSHVIADFVLHMNEQKKQKTLIVSHVKEILFQNYEKLQDAWPYGDIGLYGNSLKAGIQTTILSMLNSNQFGTRWMSYLCSISLQLMRLILFQRTARECIALLLLL